MAAPPPDVLCELNKLISTVTGFSESHENFKACYKYSLSHFVHHTYPSISKSTVKKTLDDFAVRMFTHGQFKLKDALIEQTDLFLSREDTFKANPECQIEWGLLSFVTSLSRNLAQVTEVPPLLPNFEDAAPLETFDWTAHLKEGLPTYTCSDSTDSFSSLSSEGDIDDSDTFVSAQPESEDNESASKTQVDADSLLKFKNALDECRKQQAERINPERDVRLKGNLASKWEKIAREENSQLPPVMLISENEVMDVIFIRLMTGGNFDDVRSYTVAFLAPETYKSCLEELERYSVDMGILNEFISECSGSLELPVIARTYACCLRKCLLPYELKLEEIRFECKSLLALTNEIRPLLPYLNGIIRMHSDCVNNFKSDANWKVSLRILTGLHNGMMENPRSDLRLVFLGMFLSCLAVLGDMVDVMLTSSYSISRSDEFFIVRETNESETDCVYKVLDDSGILDSAPIFAKSIVEKVGNATVPLSLVYLRNRFVSLSDLPTMNKSVFQALRNAFYTGTDLRPVDEDITDEYGVMAQHFDNEESTHFDFMQVPRWLDKDSSMLSVSKVVETAVGGVVTAQLEAVRDLACTILVKECKIDRHIALLRNILLVNDASLLLPLMHVFFNEEASWRNAEYLTLLLRECAMADFPDLADELVITMAPSAGQSHRNIIEAIDCLSLHYRVTYPVSLVITEEIMKQYNDIFRVLLKLKWAHTLCRLPFPPKNETMSLAARVVSHRLQIVRFSCIADLNVVINYFMAQATLPLPYPCAQYRDIQNLISDHKVLVRNIHARCMLSEGDQHYNLIFDTIIPVCFDLRACWTLQEAHIVARLKVMERVSLRMHAQLTRLMPFLEKETYVPLAIRLKEETYLKEDTVATVASSTRSK